MNQLSRQSRISLILFSLVIALFFLFFFYMSKQETISVYQAEETRGYGVVTNVHTELLSDDTAPIGVRKLYRWVLEPEQMEGSTLLFYISHHHVAVWFDDTLVYSLTGADDNRIGANVSSNWCVVYAGPERIGQTVTVVLTPLLEAAMDKEPTFFFGSHSSVVMEVVSGELPLLILSSVCILLGLFLSAADLYFRCTVKVDTNAMGYLGLFSVALGLWKLTDLRCIPLLFPQQAMATGYISVGALFLTGLCLLRYFISLFEKGKQKMMHLLSCAGSLLCLLVLAAQIFGITELHQNLIFSHILLIATLASVPAAALINRIVYKHWGLRKSWKLLLLILVGMAGDLLLYYHNNNNGLLSFSIIGFIVYTLIIFLTGVQDATRKAYTDSHTGLVNRTRWNELMNDQTSLPEPYAILVVDLNGLKQANDTLGHEVGDQLICGLANILRSTLPRSCVICRWGGDEFTALLTGVNRQQLDRQQQALFDAGDRYNLDHPELPIHFAIGAALSAEHPELSRTDLFRLADEEMYRNKQLWYTQKQKENLRSLP